MKTGIQIIADERARQVSVEGWTPEHDDQHTDCSLVYAAQAYQFASTAIRHSRPSAANFDLVREMHWPWADKWWKPSDDPIRNLAKAGALIAAEIDRLLRLKNPGAGQVNTRVPDCMDSGPLPPR